MIVAIDVEPLKGWSTDVDRLYTEPELYLFGVAHRNCIPLAKERLEQRTVTLPDDLPRLHVDEEVGVLPALHLPPAGGACAYCGSAGSTDEHVFPKWISRELTRLAPLQVKTEYGPRRTTTIDVTAPICGDCNTRWLSVLENDVQPILAPLLRGQETSLAAGEQHRLAGWAVKTALMLDLASGQPLIPLGFYYEFRQLRAASRSHLVWLGAYHGRRAVWADHRALGSEPPVGFVSTFTIGRCLFQVVGHVLKDVSFTDRRVAAGALWSINPAQDHAVEWPREKLAFDDAAIVELAASIEM